MASAGRRGASKSQGADDSDFRMIPQQQDVQLKGQVVKACSKDYHDRSEKKSTVSSAFQSLGTGWYNSLAVVPSLP